MTDTHKITAEWEDGYTFKFHVKSELTKVETERRINDLIHDFKPETNLELIDLIEKETDKVIKATTVNEINLNL